VPRVVRSAQLESMVRQQDMFQNAIARTVQLVGSVRLAKDRTFIATLRNAIHVLLAHGTVLQVHPNAAYALQGDMAAVMHLLILAQVAIRAHGATRKVLPLRGPVNYVFREDGVPG